MTPDLVPKPTNSNNGWKFLKDKFHGRDQNSSLVFNHLFGEFNAEQACEAKSVLKKKCIYNVCLNNGGLNRETKLLKDKNIFDKKREKLANF